MVFIGVLFEVAATMVGTAGKQLVSYSARAESKRKAHLFKVAGLLVTTLIGPVLDMAAYAFAPQAIIAPLNGLDIVWNTCSAPFTLGERVTRRHIVGSTLVFLGAMMTSLLGPHHAQVESLAWMQETFLSVRFLSYLATFAGFLLFSAVTLSARPRGVGDKARGVVLGTTAGGIAGNMYFISAGLGLLRSSAASGDWTAWSNWIPYPVLVCGVLVAVSNIPFMTKALQEYEAIFVVTLFEGSHIVVACVSGSWVLGEMDQEEPLRRAVYWCCVLVIVCGLLVIQSTARGNQWRGDGEEAKPFSEVSGRTLQRTTSNDSSVRPLTELPVELQPTRNDSGFVLWAGGMSGIGSASFANVGSDGGSTEDDSNDQASDAEQSSVALSA
mmetsp:Transcript_110799/g.320217  ORF Transcript_110799/g.320217 Transcript_110799/m.320217 type:complete len:384 (-) Transcript_110799:259-1410(-)